MIRTEDRVTNMKDNPLFSSIFLDCLVFNQTFGSCTSNYFSNKHAEEFECQISHLEEKNLLEQMVLE
jgi:hypothetical protein